MYNEPWYFIIHQLPIRWVGLYFLLLPSILVKWVFHHVALLWAVGRQFDGTFVVDKPVNGTCKFCLCDDVTEENVLISPCKCKGSC